MNEDVRRYIQTCPPCQRVAEGISNPPLRSIPAVIPFEKVNIDFSGPFPRTARGNRYIVVCMDYFTKWPEARATRDAGAMTTARFILDDIVARHGCPRTIHSDRGTSFVNGIIQALSQRFGMRQVLSTAYHPESNGLVERYNRTLGNMLSKLSMDKPTNWDHYLSLALFAYRTAVQSTTRYSPFQLLYGREAILPQELRYLPQGSSYQPEQDEYFAELTTLFGELHQQARENIQATQEGYASSSPGPEPYQVGDLVLYDAYRLSSMGSPKGQTRWTGPYQITEVKPGPSYMMTHPETGHTLRFIHPVALKKFLPPVSLDL